MFTDYAKTGLLAKNLVLAGITDQVYKKVDEHFNLLVPVNNKNQNCYLALSCKYQVPFPVS